MLLFTNKYERTIIFSFKNVNFDELIVIRIRNASDRE